MTWNVEYTDEFGRWWDTLIENQKDSSTATVELLVEYGPQLNFPHSSKLYTQHIEDLKREGLTK